MDVLIVLHNMFCFDVIMVHGRAWFSREALLGALVLGSLPRDLERKMVAPVIAWCVLDYREERERCKEIE